jgi:hypothetical protein
MSEILPVLSEPIPALGGGQVQGPRAGGQVQRPNPTS